MKTTMRLIAVSIALASGVAWGADTGAFKRYDTIARAAADLATELKSAQTDFTSVDIGDFRSSNSKSPSPGTGIKRELEKVFQAAGISVARDSHWKLTGVFQTEVKGSGEPTLEIKWTLADNDKDLTQVRNGRLSVRGKEDIIVTGGVTGPLPLTRDESALQQATAKNIQTPSPAISTTVGAGGTIARASRDGQFGLEIVVDGKPRVLRQVDGALYFDLNPAESFQIHIINNAEFDAGVTVSVDGVNVFAFQETVEGQPPLNDWRIGRTGGYIAGWYVNRSRIDSFRHTPNDKEIAANLLGQSTEEVGTITAVLKAAWDEGATPPASEPVVTGSKGGVGRGPSLQVDLKSAATQFGVIRESITVRYQRSPNPAVAAGDNAQPKVGSTSQARQTP